MILKYLAMFNDVKQFNYVNFLQRQKTEHLQGWK